MSSVNVEKSYHEGMIKSNHDLTVNGVEALKKLRNVQSEINDLIRHFEPLVNHSKQFPHNIVEEVKTDEVAE